jgi:indoleamine 2,3-dioxygenase
VIAKPWVSISRKLERPPVLSYASYCLDNWYLMNSEEPINLNNVALINNFLGGIDEDWFVTIHVCIEDAASDAMEASKLISQCTEESEESYIEELLNRISQSMQAVNNIFERMPERCDPYVYYHRVRPFIFGSKDNPDLENGIVYQGEFGDVPQFYRGETGAQSSIMPTLDGALGIEHTKDSLRHYLNEMRDYMPKEHRQFIEEVETNSMTKKLVRKSSLLINSYNDCLEQIRAFRALHLKYARIYIHNQSKQKNPFGAGGSTIHGTGGTPFMSYLKKHRDETEQQKQ